MMKDFEYTCEIHGIKYHAERQDISFGSYTLRIAIP